MKGRKGVNWLIRLSVNRGANLFGSISTTRMCGPAALAGSTD